MGALTGAQRPNVLQLSCLSVAESLALLRGAGGKRRGLDDSVCSTRSPSEQSDVDSRPLDHPTVYLLSALFIR